MAVTLALACRRLSSLVRLKSQTSISTQVAFIYSRPPLPIQTYEDLMKERTKKDPVLYPDIYIGLPVSNRKDRSSQLKQWNVDRQKLEQASRLQKLDVPVEKVKEKWVQEQWPNAMYKVAKHYGIFRDLFDNAYFYPQQNFHVFYDYDEEFLTPVYNGNKILPSEAAVLPFVEINLPPEEKDSLWSLILTSPDGHLQDNTAEYLHWFVGNIPAGRIEEGEVICDYLQPFPVKGTGCHRYVFLLYKQERQLDFTTELRPQKCKSLDERTFKNVDLYRKFEADLTPAGLTFFQCEWDNSVTQVFHDILEMPEPVFEFIWPHRFHPKEKKWPHQKPFNKYLDTYRDIKDIQEEVLKEKLKRTSPFKPRSPRPKYPNIYRLPMTYPKWLRSKIMKMRLAQGQWKDLY